MITLNALFEDIGIDPETILVMRHQPYEPNLRRIFPYLALERRDLFNAYQSAHNPKAESALVRAKHLASFIADGGGRALFVGLYRNDGHAELSRKQWYARADNNELLDLGMLGWESKDRQKALWFDLVELDSFRDWWGKLVVRWPPPDRAWYRWADRNPFEVLAIHEESLLQRPPPNWDELALTWAELSLLPQKLKAGLEHWRGVYLITDRSDGARYVGSAYGSENLLGRWVNYSKSGHGGNKLLKERDCKNFVFSILQRVSPDLPPDQVVAIEANWKIRLGSRAPHGLNDN